MISILFALKLTATYRQNQNNYIMMLQTIFMGHSPKPNGRSSTGEMYFSFCTSDGSVFQPSGHSLFQILLSFTIAV